MMRSRLDGKSVAIFGGSSGVGMAVAEQAAGSGARVTIASRNRDRLNAALSVLPAADSALVDVRQVETVREFFEGRDPFHHVVVSAAQLTTSPLRERPLSDAHAAFDSKLWGAVNVAHAARIRENGSLTLVSGMIGSRPSGRATVLSAINAAIDALAKALATEMAPVRVNCVSPGRLDTPWWNHLDKADKRILLDRTAAALPVKRVGRADEIAAQIVHMMLNEFMTGSVVLIDGGGSVA